MVKRSLHIGRWVVDFLFASDSYDVDGVLGCLYDAYAPYSVMRKAKDFMLEDKLNTGFTYTNEDMFRGVVVIGPSESGEEFIDTLVHEVHHLAVAIASELGVDLEGETPAYLSGDSARALASVICEMGCSSCRQ